MFFLKRSAIESNRAISPGGSASFLAEGRVVPTEILDARFLTNARVTPDSNVNARWFFDAG